LSEEKWRELVSELRRDQFGITEDSEVKDTSNKGNTLVAIQRRRLDRALSRLSGELYSSNAHCIYELLQNSDDAQYTQGDPATCEIVGVRSELGSFLAVLSNEKGFTKANLKAICDVGASTKAGDVHTIGEKGIGFKSVFRLSDNPQIHSNGLHIAFNPNKYPAGAIVPEWIPPERRTLYQKAKSLSSTNCKSGVLLPLKSSLSNHSLESLWKEIGGFPTAVVLFLRRIHRLHIRLNVLQRDISCQERIFGVKGVLEVKVRSFSPDNLRKTRWILYRPPFHSSEPQHLRLAFSLPLNPCYPDNVYSEVESRDYKEWSRLSRFAHICEMARESALNQYSNSRNREIKKDEYVYAFLPIAKYGLRMAVQGDFKMPSSRERVDGDAEHNYKLRDAIAVAFGNSLDLFVCEALADFREKSKSTEKTEKRPKYARRFRELGAVSRRVTHYFTFVPMEGQVIGFFSPVVSQIHRLLKSIECIPCLVTNTIDKEATAREIISRYFKQPARAVYLWDVNLTLSVVPADLLHRLLPSYGFVHPEVFINTELRLRLGIQDLSLPHLLTIAQNLLQALLEPGKFQENSRKIPNPPLGWFASFWTLVYHTFSRPVSSPLHSAERRKAFDDLKVLPLIPAETALSPKSEETSQLCIRLRAAEGKGEGERLFLPPSYTLDGKESQLRELKVNVEPLVDSNGSMWYISRAFCTILGEDRPLVIRMLKMMGVVESDPVKIIDCWVIPLFQRLTSRATTKCKASPDEEKQIISATNFLRIHQLLLLAPENEKVLEKVKNSAVILTQKGEFVSLRGHTPLHFSREYAQFKPPSCTQDKSLPPSAFRQSLSRIYPGAIIGSDIEEIFEGTGIEVNMVSGRYLGGGGKCEEWVRIFQILGVPPFLRVISNKDGYSIPILLKLSKLAISKLDGISATSVKGAKAGRRGRKRKGKKQRNSPLGQDERKRIVRRFALIVNGLTRHWSSYYETFNHLSLHLKTVRFVPAVHYPKDFNLFTPNQAFIDTPTIRGCLQAGLCPFVTLRDINLILSSQNELKVDQSTIKEISHAVKSIGLKGLGNNSTEVLDLLVSRDLTDSKEEMTFTVEGWVSTYRLLTHAKKSLPPDKLKRCPIWIPVTRPSYPTDRLPGKFYPASKCVWNDRSAVLEQDTEDDMVSIRILDYYYKDVIDQKEDWKEVFGFGNVSSSVSVGEYVNRIVAVTSRYGCNDGGRAKALRLMAAAGVDFQRNGVNKEILDGIKERLWSIRVFPTRENRYASLQDGILVYCTYQSSRKERSIMARISQIHPNPSKNSVMFPGNSREISENSGGFSKFSKESAQHSSIPNILLLHKSVGGDLRGRDVLRFLTALGLTKLDAVIKLKCNYLESKRASPSLFASLVARTLLFSSKYFENHFPKALAHLHKVNIRYMDVTLCTSLYASPILYHLRGSPFPVRSAISFVESKSGESPKPTLFICVTSLPCLALPYSTTRAAVTEVLSYITKDIPDLPQAHHLGLRNFLQASIKASPLLIKDTESVHTKANAMTTDYTDYAPSAHDIEFLTSQGVLDPQKTLILTLASEPKLDPSESKLDPSESKTGISESLVVASEPIAEVSEPKAAASEARGEEGELRSKLRGLGLASYGDKNTLQRRLDAALASGKKEGLGRRSMNTRESAEFQDTSAYLETAGDSDTRSVTIDPSVNLRDTGVLTLDVRVPSSAPGFIHSAVSTRGQVSSQVRRQIGDWGEKFVYEYLKETKGSEGLSVVWVNEKGESGSPYDIIMKDALGRVTYIEVKTTIFADLRRFPMSWNELLFAAEHGQRYEIYRVFAAPQRKEDADQVRIVRVQNPVKRLSDRMAKLYFGMDA